MANGANVTLNYAGIFGADSGTVPAPAVGGPGTAGGNGGNAAINVAGNIFQPMGASLAVTAAAIGGNGNGAGNGGNATAALSGNIIQTSRTLSSINVQVQATAGTGTKDGNATATASGNIIQYSGATATNVTLAALATDPAELPGFTGSLYGTKSATLSGNIVSGNVNNVTLQADAFFNNATATINGNIISAKAANTGFVTLEATGQKIAINGNIVNLGQQELDLTLNELAPTAKATVSGNIFNGTGNNTFKLTDNPGTSDTFNINLATNSFTFNGASNTINKFGSIALAGNFAGTLSGTSGNNTLDASGDTTTGTIIFQGNGGTDTLKAGATALNVADFAGSDWQYNAPVGANSHPVSNTTISTIPANIIAPNAVIPAASDTLVGTFQRLKFLSPAEVSDLNDDGHGDLIFQHSVTGGTEFQLQLGNTIVTLNTPAVITPLKVIGTGQFTSDTDRFADILLQNTATKDLSIISGINTTTGTNTVTPFTVQPGAGWNAITTGDFNGDAAADVLLQQGPGGPAEIMFLNTKAGEATGKVDLVSAVTTPGANWNAISSGDFNADGNSDILWQNSTNGALDVSLMNGATGTPTAVTYTTFVPSTNFTAVGTGDFNGDGKSDILLRNNTTGDAVVLFMNGATETGSPLTVTGPGAGWTLSGAEDVNRDGFSDLLWQNTTTGQVVTQEMTTSGVPLGGLFNLGAPPSGAGLHQLVASTGGG